MIVVTGASGFIGRHLCRELARRKYVVRGVVRQPPETGLPDGWVIVRDFGQGHDLAGAMNGARAVVHLAARVHILRDEAPSPLTAFREANVEGTRAVMQAAIKARVPRVVFTSSVKAMAEESGTVLTEAVEPAPVDSYGISKREAELVTLELASECGAEAAVLRLPLVYGPGMRANMLRLFNLVARGVPLPLGRVRNRRSLIYVGNVVEGIIAVIEASAIGRQVFLTSDGEDLSTPSLIEAIAAVLGKKARLIPTPVWALKAVGRVGDQIARVVPFPFTSLELRRLTGSLAVDGSKLRRSTGFHPPFTVTAGLKATAQWYQTRAP